MNPTILGVIVPGFLNQVPTLQLLHPEILGQTFRIEELVGRAIRVWRLGWAFGCIPRHITCSATGSRKSRKWSASTSPRFLQLAEPLHLAHPKTTDPKTQR